MLAAGLYSASIFQPSAPLRTFPGMCKEATMQLCLARPMAAAAAASAAWLGVHQLSQMALTMPGVAVVGLPAWQHNSARWQHITSSSLCLNTLAKGEVLAQVVPHLGWSLGILLS